ncbi:MAG TPA: ABC transporter permease subunit, partial [Candidatus Dormibacteraeota bacterium]
MSAILNAFWNPIVDKEYRSRMRTWRSPLAMTVYILLIGGLGWAIFAAMTFSARNSYGGGQAANYGQGLFIYLLIFQMVLLTFITPALTAGAISSERERQTIDLLFVTRIPPFSILWGKLLASMSFVLLLLLLSVPIFSLVFLFGGIELDQVLTAFLVTAVAALTLGVI